MTFTEEMISIQDLSYRFTGNETDTLHNANLEIHAGDFIVLTGPSGCGKSTLALAIGGYLFSQYDGTAVGRVLIDGINVQEAPVFEIADKVGLVQQNPEAQFCTLTVQDEIAFGLENRRLPRSEIQERLNWSLNVVNAGDLINRELASLSGGEKQKIAIAAIMASKPQVLIFDEPTSNLDPTATKDIFDVIADLRKQADITVIVIEHKTEYLSAFQPRLIKMEKGHIVYDGHSDNADPSWSLKDKKEYPSPVNKDPIVAVKDLSAGYNDRKVLKNISLNIYPGEFVAIMGDNGSGKSTLLRNLIGLHKPTQGQVEIFGKDVKRLPVHEHARTMGLVFQNPEHQLFASSVWDESIFAARNFGILDDTIVKNADRLLLECGLQDRKSKHPYRLSYGEKRRLNLISVLTYTPSLLLLDEILIGQDITNAVFLLDLLQEQTKNGGAAIMVNHNPEISYQYASRLIFFEKGQILVDAPIQEGFKLLAEAGKTSYLPHGFSSVVRGDK